MILKGLQRQQPAVHRARQLALLQLFQAAIGMTFEAIDLYAGIEMTACTKVLGIGVAHSRFSGLARVMTIHTADQAVFAVAITFEHRGIALM